MLLRWINTKKMLIFIHSVFAQQLYTALCKISEFGFTVVLKSFY